ncbi:hypothetical protein HMPREF1557_00258 [Streptococcus sobrinus W1703]|uniref:Uncharacterized protein n=1 Tax=Streptococcus sobrinus W1703 TaxID=1227275 RepID=U2JF83_9STRE|nr:hypothetical protein HMPREF1557_00258 [Streptococcus sobrinus W1703]
MDLLHFEVQNFRLIVLERSCHAKKAGPTGPTSHQNFFIYQTVL